jgi:heat shock protein HslJ
MRARPRTCHFVGRPGQAKVERRQARCRNRARRGLARLGSDSAARGLLGLPAAMTTAALTATLLAGIVFLASACGDDGGDEAPASLDGTSWKLVEGTSIAIPDDVEMTIAFESGRASGSGGCNQFMGPYDQAGEQISLGRLASTRMACAEEVMGAERAYLSALESVTSSSATGGVLVLSDSSGQALLRYEATSE